MAQIQSIDQLNALYQAPAPTSLSKVVNQITPAYASWIEASKFLILATVGDSGVDASPRGDRGPVVKIQNPKTLLLPDWRGNNRLDSLRNIVSDGRSSLIFLIPGIGNMVRVNAKATLHDDADLRSLFSRNGKQPTIVLRFHVHETYFQCAKAIMRSNLWAQQTKAKEVPSAGEFLAEVQDGFDGPTYDEGYAAYAAARMW